jgi:quercetin dioxygenase-like cupin family protein
MAEIMLIRDGAIPWEEAPPEWQANQKAGDTGLRFKRLMSGAAGLNVQRTEYNPHRHEAPHSHPEDEILFVLSGTLFFGREELGFGDAIFVPREKIYSLRTGETGAGFVRVGFGKLRAADSSVE